MMYPIGGYKTNLRNELCGAIPEKQNRHPKTSYVLYIIMYPGMSGLAVTDKTSIYDHISVLSKAKDILPYSNSV